jgi:hypothetical protein
VTPALREFLAVEIQASSRTPNPLGVGKVTEQLEPSLTLAGVVTYHYDIFSTSELNASGEMLAPVLPSAMY